MQEGQNFSSESRNLSGLHFHYILNAPLPPNVRIPIFQGQNLLVPNLRPKKFRGPICPPKKFRGPICLEAHTPLWQGRKVSEIHFLRGEASLIFPPIGKGVPMHPPVQWMQHPRCRIWYLSIFYKPDILHKHKCRISLLNKYICTTIRIWMQDQCSFEAKAKSFTNKVGRSQHHSDPLSFVYSRPDIYDIQS